MKKSFREMNSFREKHREEAFQRYLESSKPYFEAVEAAGDEPWFTSIEERRQLWMRRYAPKLSGMDRSTSHV